MKQKATMFMSIVMIIIVGVINTIHVVAEEAIIESITEKKDNLWEKRSLIQATSFEDEYLGAVRLGAFTMPSCDNIDWQSLYEEAHRCVVRIEMGQYAASGLIWRMEEKGMVITGNKHLLCEAAYGMVTFTNGTSLLAEVMGYSQDYDIGFLFIPREDLTWEVLRDCYEVRMLGNIQDWIEEYKEKSAKVIQIASSKQVAQDKYEGAFVKITYVPEFQNDMLETECYSKAGMSGGGVFNENGYLIGMIAGGNVGEYDSVRESEVTYSIPAQDIEAEYQRIMELMK